VVDVDVEVDEPVGPFAVVEVEVDDAGPVVVERADVVVARAVVVVVLGRVATWLSSS
jgi:hypothetical protein